MSFGKFLFFNNIINFLSYFNYVLGYEVIVIKDYFYNLSLGLRYLNENFKELEDK